MRNLFFVLLVACTPAPTPPSPPPSASASAPAPASASATATASPPASARPDAGASPEEQALVSALRKDHAALVACHRASKDATGDMTVRVTIGPNGKVEATSIEANLTIPMSLARCIEERVRAVRVAISPVTIPIPFHFRKSPYDGPTVLYGSGPFDPGY